MRKLVTKRIISHITPIANRDRVSLATVDGWQVIVKNEEFSPGDECLFFEIDSFLPVREPFLFLGKPTTYSDQQGFHLETMKMAGVVSQGLALPLRMFPDLEDAEDYSEQLGVIKYDVATVGPKSQTGTSKGSFPSFIPKTDQERIQNLVSLFHTHADHQFEETLKLDGSPMTCYKLPVDTRWYHRLFPFLRPLAYFGVCSRNLELEYDTKDDGYTPTSDFWKAAINTGIPDRLPEGYAVQGELIGPKIHANHEKVETLEYYIFSVYCIATRRYLLPTEAQHFCKLHGLPYVPVTNPSATPLSVSLPELLSSVEGESMNPGTVSEGKVYKSLTVPNLTFKVISNNYLLKSKR